MPSLPHQQPKKRDFPGRRWLNIALRSVHLVGVVLLGAALLGSGDRELAGTVVLASGLWMYALDLWSNPWHFGELAGIFILIKLLLVAGLVIFPGAAAPLFWTLVVGSSLVSHAPGHFRHIRVFG